MVTRFRRDRRNEALLGQIFAARSIACLAFELKLKRREEEEEDRPVKRFLAKFAYVGSGVAMYSLVLAQC